MAKKKCSYCLRTLPADMFEQGSNSKGDYARTECRTCTQEKRVKAKNQTPYTYLNLLFTQLKSSVLIALLLFLLVVFLVFYRCELQCSQVQQLKEK